MYSMLLKQYVESAGRVADKQRESDLFLLICVIHKVVSPQHSYDAISDSIIKLMKGDFFIGSEMVGHDRAIKRLRDLTRSLAAHTSNQFDAKLLLDSFLALGDTTDRWSSRDEELRARLIFHFVVLSVATFYRNDVSGIAAADEVTVRNILNDARRSVLTWCCTKYGPHFVAGRKRKNATSKDVDSVSGLRPPNYQSVFTSNLADVPKWLDTMRCMLLIEDSDSPKMKKLVFPQDTTTEEDAEWEGDLPIIRCCCKLSGRVGADLISTVLRSTTVSHGIDPEMAIQILENLFHSCRQAKQGVLEVDDPDLVWELYSLVQYEPQRSSGKSDDKEIREKIDQLPR
jgi:hypothetical protein